MDDCQFSSIANMKQNKTSKTTKYFLIYQESKREERCTEQNTDTLKPNLP
jgi:hypothetical protein